MCVHMCTCVCVCARTHERTLTCMYSCPSLVSFLCNWGQGGNLKGFRDAEWSWGLYTKAEGP